MIRDRIDTSWIGQLDIAEEFSIEKKKNQHSNVVWKAKANYGSDIQQQKMQVKSNLETTKKSGKKSYMSDK